MGDRYGQAHEFKDKSGNTLYLIFYEGRIYLPVRAVLETAGLEVDWDNKIIVSDADYTLWSMNIDTTGYDKLVLEIVHLGWNLVHISLKNGAIHTNPNILIRDIFLM